MMTSMNHTIVEPTYLEFGWLVEEAKWIIPRKDFSCFSIYVVSTEKRREAKKESIIG